MSAAQRYARAFNVSVDWLLFGKTEGPDRMSGFVDIIGRAAAGIWLEIGAVGPFDDDTMISPIFLRNHPEARQFAVKVEGGHANKVLPDGIYAIAARTDGFREPQDGDLVVFRRDREDFMEITIKRYIRRGDKTLLLPETDDSRMQHPIEYVEFDPQGAVIMQILGIVLGATLIF